MKALLGKVREIVKNNKSATQANLILQLNPIIRGWAMYHRHVVSKSLFSSIDAQIVSYGHGPCAGIPIKAQAG